MGDLVQADIFFFISTVLLTAATIVFIVAIIYVIKLVREARRVATIVREETERIAADIGRFREHLHEEGVVSIASGLFHKKRKVRKPK